MPCSSQHSGRGCGCSRSRPRYGSGATLAPAWVLLVLACWLTASAAQRAAPAPDPLSITCDDEEDTCEADLCPFDEACPFYNEPVRRPGWGRQGWPAAACPGWHMQLPAPPPDHFGYAGQRGVCQLDTGSLMRSGMPVACECTQATAAWPPLTRQVALEGRGDLGIPVAQLLNLLNSLAAGTVYGDDSRTWAAGVGGTSLCS